MTQFIHPTSTSTNMDSWINTATTEFSSKNEDDCTSSTTFDSLLLKFSARFYPKWSASLGICQAAPVKYPKDEGIRESEARTPKQRQKFFWNILVLKMLISQGTFQSKRNSFLYNNLFKIIHYLAPPSSKIGVPGRWQRYSHQHFRHGKFGSDVTPQCCSPP